ncbi:MAG: hypothetical protein JXB35_10390 [Anaerolineae bacterium]|nr:hypothetical protein [Anaerolineae bacterium]
MGLSPALIFDEPAAATPWWLADGETPLIAYQPKGAASKAASLINLANPGTYNGVEIGSLVWDAASGWTGTAADSDSVVDTGLVWTANYMMFIQFSNWTSTGNLVGVQGGTSQYVFLASYSGPTFYYCNGGTSFKTGTVASAGNYAMGGGNAYYNGVPDASGLGGTMPLLSLSILGKKMAGVYDDCATASVQAFAVYSGVLSGATIASIATRMAAL